MADGSTARPRHSLPPRPDQAGPRDSPPPRPDQARLKQVRGFVLDMDGTLVLSDRRSHGMRPLPGALELTAWLSRQGLPYRIFTNGTGRSPGDYATLLRGVGFDLPDGAVLTPADSAADLFARRGYRRVLALGTGLADSLRSAGIEPVPPGADASNVDAVLVGLYRDFTMDALEAACHVVWRGVPVYSASQASFFATADGRALGTSRAISAMLSSATGCRVELVGKPSRHALGLAGRRLGVPLRQLAVVGDDPELEVPMAHRGGALAISVATGLAGADAFDGVPEHRRPHLSLSGVDELLAMLAGQA
ncbi:MAG: HAD hydrolase-like protein [Micromonosporaceae bacterium]|nr:HAD hydrolase-like protein [Micromonosporaceae bacterium]